VRKQNALYAEDPPVFRPERPALVMGAAILFVILILSAYFYTTLREAQDIAAVDELSGQRIGCCAGWEVDLLLSKRDDVTLLRYESNADCVLALCYGQVDAIGIDEMSATTVMKNVTGVQMLPDPIAAVGCTFYVNRQREDLLQDFNDFASGLLSADYYQAFHDRAVYADGDTYDMPDIEVLTEGEHIRVGYVPDCYPECFYDFVTGEIQGYGVETMERFALEKGYVIDWVETTDMDAMIQLSLNKLDMCASYISDVYREETEAGTTAHMTEAYLFCNVFLVQMMKNAVPVMNGLIE